MPRCARVEILAILSALLLPRHDASVAADPGGSTERCVGEYCPAKEIAEKSLIQSRLTSDKTFAPLEETPISDALWRVDSGTSTSGQCVLDPQDAVPIDPNLFGMNTVIGPVIQTPYSDKAVMAAMDAMKPGLLRYPGGTVANYWSMQTGSYVGPSGSSEATHCAKTGYWNWCKFQKLIQNLPPKTFTPDKFYDILGRLGANGMPQGPIYVLNVFSLSLEEIYDEIDFLKALSLPVKMIELGNELDFPKYEKIMTNGSVYVETVRPVAKRLREVFPGVKLAFVVSTRSGPAGGWNDLVSQHLDLVDAVAVHDYSPNKAETTGYTNNGTVVSGWGAKRNRWIMGQVRKRFPKKEVWRSEFNYPSWNSGPPMSQELLPGAMQGITWASTVIGGVNEYNDDTPMRVLVLYDFAWEPSTKWGDGRYHAVHISSQADAVDKVRVSGIGQIFAHLSRAALVHAGGSMWQIAPSIDRCGRTSFSIKGSGRAHCLVAAAFSSDAATDKGATIAVVNQCDTREATFNFSNLLPGGDADRYNVVVTQYDSDDAGGFAPLPPDPDQVPWTTGPLKPKVSTLSVTGRKLSTLTLNLPSASLTIATASQASTA